VVELPVVVSLGSVEFHKLILSNTEPTPPDGYIVLQLGEVYDLKIWLIYKVIE